MTSPQKPINTNSSFFETIVLNKQKRKSKNVNAELNFIQEHWKNHNSLTYPQLSYFIAHFSPDFEENERKKLEEFRKKFMRTNLYSCVFSLVNVVLASAYVKSFLMFSNFKKLLFGGCVFMTSYQLGMYQVKKDFKEFNIGLSEKYKNEFLSKKFT